MLKTINLTTPICKTSYGYVGQNIVKALINKGVDVSLRILGKPDPDIECGYDKYVEQCKPKFFEDAPHIIIWHANGLERFCLKDKMNWGFPIFEMDRFQPQEVDNLNKCNGLLCCSKWAKDILRGAVGPTKPIGVAPLGVDSDVFFPITDGKPIKTLKFINMGKWEVRKNQTALIKAFAKVFKGKNDVSLTLACYNEFFSEQENKKWANFAKKAFSDFGLSESTLNIFPFKLNSQKDINILLNQHQIGVFPALAEGWNLEFGEMLHLHKPCIGTFYSGHTEFLSELSGKLFFLSENPKVISIQQTEPAYDGHWFVGQGNWVKWGKEQDEQLEHYLSECYTDSYNSDSTFDFSGFAKFRYIEKFTWENTVNHIIEVLNV